MEKKKLIATPDSDVGKEIIDQQLEILKTLNKILNILDTMAKKQKAGKF